MPRKKIKYYSYFMSFQVNYKDRDENIRNIEEEIIKFPYKIRNKVHLNRAKKQFLKLYPEVNEAELFKYSFLYEKNEFTNLI
jgi:hypothetical protein